MRQDVRQIVRTGTAATFAPEVSPLAIGAVAMGIGGLVQMLMALKQIRASWSALRVQWLYVLIGAVAIAIYPLTFYSSMHMAGVTVGTVVTIGSAPLLGAVIERIFDGKSLTRRWMIGASLGITGTLLLCVAEAKGQTGSDAGLSLGDNMIGVGLIK